MAVTPNTLSTSEYWMSPDALSIELNAMDDPQYLQVSLLAGSVIIAYKQDVIAYDSSLNYRKWNLQAYNNFFDRTDRAYVYAQLEKKGNTALIVYSYDILELTETITNDTGESREVYNVYLGTISSSVNSNGESIPRMWETTFETGSLNTDKNRQEDQLGEWSKMFRLNKVTDMIEVLKDITSATIHKLYIGARKIFISDVQTSSESDQSLEASDNIIPTTKFLKVSTEKKFHRKDQTDSNPFLQRFLGGLEIGTYASGISGAQISSDGAAELLNLLLRGALTIGDYQVKKSGAKIDEEGVADLLAILVRDGMESANFSTGALGAGFCLKKDENGDSYLEVDRMLVRKVATFIELHIQQIKHVGGQIILTPASMSCVKVEDKGDFYRCYFENTDGEKTIEQEFEVGDLARAQTFNVKEGVNDNVTNTYYWRAVVGTGDNYIDLSKTDCDVGSTEPKAGDDIVQLGNKSDATRQAAIILSAYGNDAPYFKLYRGINSYSLDGKEFVSFSRSEVMIIADTIRFSSGETIEEYINNVTGGLVVDVEAAKKAAEEAQKAAEQASADASEAVERLDSWSADGVISPTEKQSLKDEIARIDADKTQIANGYAKYNLGTPTNYNNAHTAYRAVLVTLTASSPETITIPSDFATKQTAYYTQRTNALTAISNAARDYAETISNDLTSYKKTVTSQFEQTNNSITAAVTSSKEYTNNAINNIQIGVRNYIPNSALTKELSEITDIGWDQDVVVSIDTNNTYDYINSLKVIQNTPIMQNGGLNRTYWYTINKVVINPASFTAFVKADRDNVTLRIRFGGFTTDEKFYKITIGTQWKKIELENINDSSNQNFILFGATTACTFWMCKPMLVGSTKTTDWSPAPEDAENALTEYKKEVTAQLSIMEGEISSKVSSTEMTTIKQEILNSAATDATNKINNIQIGGRNYFAFSRTRIENNSGTGEYDKSINGAILTTGSRTTSKTIVRFNNFGLTDAGDYTLSCEIKATSDVTLKIDICDYTILNNIAVTNQYKKIKLTGRVASYINGTGSYYGFVDFDEVSDIPDGVKIYIKNFKLEAGNKATDWSPAPEDYATITTVESMQTEITQLSGEISLRAYKTEVTAVQNNLDKTNSNLSSLTTRVSEAEIALQPDNIWIGISSKVTTTSKVNNIVPDSCFDDANYSLLYTGGSRVSASTANNSCPTSYCMKSTQRDVQAKNYVAVAEGEKYYVSAYVNAQLANYTVRVGLILKKSDGTTSWYNNGSSVAAKTSGWQKLSGYITIPAGYTKAGIWFQIDGSSNFGSAYFTKVYAYKVDESVNQNYALLTSTEKKLTTFSNINNQTWNVYNITGLKKGDIITVSFEYEASNLNFNTTTEHTAKINCQFGSSYGWAGTTFDLKSNGSGKYISKPITVGGTATETTKDNIFFRLDYISSVLQDNNPIGYFRVWKMKVEKGERSTPWSAAPSDYSTTEEIKAGMQITDKGFNFFGQEFNFSGRISVGDLDPTIIEDGYLRASLINADTLVVKTLNASNTDGVSTLVNKDGMKMTQGSNVLFKLTSNKATVGTTRYYAQMDLTTVYSDGSTLQGTLTPESLFLRGKTKSTDKTLKTTLMYNGLMVYDENGTGLTVNTKGIQLTYCGRTQGGSDVCSVVHYAKCIFSAYITASGYLNSFIGGSIPNSSGTPIEFSVSRTGAGRYKVTHNINDQKYFGQITALSNGSLTVGIFENRNSTSFDYSTISFDGNGWYAKDCGVYLSIYYESPMLFTF